MSPSMRREWIEMTFSQHFWMSRQSPSMRREWIEIYFSVYSTATGAGSPSMRREWIEILLLTAG